MRIFVTGASGFVGKHTLNALRATGHDVVAGVRTTTQDIDPAIKQVTIGDQSKKHDWDAELKNIDAVVHLAGLTQTPKGPKEKAERQLRETNVLATERLADAAIKMGVSRFVFISSIKVNGETSTDGPFTANSPPAPQDGYARSKLETEQLLLERHFANSSFDVVTIRPPLVYGSGSKGNLTQLLKALKLGMPLPFGALKNQRDFIAAENLADLIVRCTEHSKAPGKTFLACDGQSFSTPGLLRTLAASANVTARLFSVPERYLRLFLRVLGQKRLEQRLIDSLQIDATHTQEILDWSPPFHADKQLLALARPHKTSGR